MNIIIHTHNGKFQNVFEFEITNVDHKVFVIEYKDVVIDGKETCVYVIEEQSPDKIDSKSEILKHVKRHIDGAKDSISLRNVSSWIT